MAKTTNTPFQCLCQFANDVSEKFKIPAEFSPEDQLKTPIETLLKSLGTVLKKNIQVITEVHETEISGRPDVGVTIDGLLTGHIELKAPSKGADPNKLKGADKIQWSKFRDLPNLIYTNGNEWALYRNGERIGSLVRVASDISEDGDAGITEKEAIAFFTIVQDFLSWDPIVPSTPKALAEILAPLCRLLKADVLDAIQDKSSDLSNLAKDWRTYLFPDADDKQFADAYAQTLTYALLLAKFSGATELTTDSAAKAIKAGHKLLSDALKILSVDDALKTIEVPISLLERAIGAIDIAKLSAKSKGDLWLYFYEDFLGAYDLKMKRDRGVYYTPVEVVKTQIHLIDELLEDRFGTEMSFADPAVITLDPACGTGTYVLAALHYALEKIEKAQGTGMRVSAATNAANNMHAFELLVGPYAVAHLRLTQQLTAEGGTLPGDGVHVYLADTLESPHGTPPKHLPLVYKNLGEEHKRAQKVKASTPVLVCFGNPPYDRQEIEQQDEGLEKRKGGWVRFGDEGIEGTGILQDFIKPLTEAGDGIHAKNLYNDYVYFWRWALWKVFESSSPKGIVSFITGASYLRGPGFAGMRKIMRQTFDELWLIDLEGDAHGARETENIFAIQTPVVIAVGVRTEEHNDKKPAIVHYTRVTGTKEEKLQRLDEVTRFSDLKWKKTPKGWVDPFIPITKSDYWKWPLLTDVFPWQENGVQFKRSWPIAETPELLTRRWKKLLSASGAEQRRALKETGARTVDKEYKPLFGEAKKTAPINTLKATSPSPEPTRYGFRSLDRHWCLLDVRLCDRPRRGLVASHGSKQLYLTSLLTVVLGEGPSAFLTNHVPDLHHFCNRGAKDVIPLWRDSEAKQPNVTAGVLSAIGKGWSKAPTAEELFAYCYAILFSPEFVQAFWEELTTPGPRVPITKDETLFRDVAKSGASLIWLHTFGEAMPTSKSKVGKIPSGKARCKVGTPTKPADYPEDFKYDWHGKVLYVGTGVFEHVEPEVWTFSLSGFNVLQSWLGYRMRKRAGKKSSALDDLRPNGWQFDEELLKLIWIIEATLKQVPDLNSLLSKVIGSSIATEQELPKPTEKERKSLYSIEEEEEEETAQISLLSQLDEVEESA